MAGADKEPRISPRWVTIKAVRSANAAAFDLQQRGKLLQLVRDMADADRTMVGGTMDVPFIDEPPGANRETISAVCVSDLQDGTGNGFSWRLVWVFT